MGGKHRDTKAQRHKEGAQLHRGKTVQKQQLLDVVWKDAFASHNDFSIRLDR